MRSQHTLELTLLQIASQSGEPMDSQTLYDVRNEIRNVLAVKERQRQRMTAPAFQWNKPRPPR